MEGTSPAFTEFNNWFRKLVKNIVDGMNPFQTWWAGGGGGVSGALQTRSNFEDV